MRAIEREYGLIVQRLLQLNGPGLMLARIRRLYHS
jgi:hypothetical protein